MSYRYATPVPLLQQIIDSHHFSELMAEESINPRGEARADARHGILCATIVNMWRDTKRSAAAKPADFIPKWERETEQTPEEMLAWAKRFAGLKG